MLTLLIYYFNLYFGKLYLKLLIHALKRTYLNNLQVVQRYSIEHLQLHKHPSSITSSGEEEADE